MTNEDLDHDEGDNTHPFTEHSLTPHGDSLVFADVPHHPSDPIAPLFHHWTTSYKIGVDRRASGDESLMQCTELKRGGFRALK
ncbi:hypothetical protein N7486_010408 [Penicillium sp. IBT 16267x]|nr:hypothetical protein N7486_010408 [Penicillium sp. IBT 16267x]